MIKLNILFYGDGPWAHLSLEKIIESNEFNIKGVVLRYETQDPTLRNIAEKNDIEVYVSKNVNSDEFINFSKSLDLDLSVSMSFNQIIKEKLRQTNRIGFINCHAGKLPWYRGRNILNWVLINDEKEFGITTHFIDDGIDTGDIINQAIIPIEDDDDYSTLLKKAIQKSPEVLYDALIKIKSGNYNTIKQNHIAGSYFSYRRIGDEYIDWNWSSRRIYNFVRAITDPAPGAQTFLNGKKVYIWEAKETEFENYISTPGEIINKDNEGIYVKTGNSVIKLTRISTDDNPNKRIPNFNIGKRFENYYDYKINSLEEKIRYLENKLGEI